MESRGAGDDETLLKGKPTESGGRDCSESIGDLCNVTNQASRVVCLYVDAYARRGRDFDDDGVSAE